MTVLKYNGMNLEPMTITELIDRGIKNHSGRNALGFYNQKPMTYAEMGEKIKKTSTALTDNEIRPGDKVAIIGESSPDWTCAYLGIIYRGAVAVPILPDFPSDDIINIINHSESKFLFASSKQIEKLKKSGVDTPLRIIVLDDCEISLPGSNIQTYSGFIKKVKIEKIKDVAAHKADENDIAVIMYTSGTTGLSKGVLLSHKNLLAAVLGANECVNLDKNEKFLSVLPVSHVFEGTLGLLLPLLHGASIYYIGKTPTADVLREACDVVKPSVMCLVPLIIERVYNKKVKPKFQENFVVKNLIKIPPFKKLIYHRAVKAIVQYFGGNLKVIAFGGAPLDKEVENFLMKGHFPYVFGYGLTEAAGLACGAPNIKNRARSCGFPIRHLDVKIVDPESDTGVGEIMIKGPTVMAGYFKNDELSRETLTKDRWLKTGDRGIVGKNGYLYIKGRSKNMFLSASGENVYPEIIEEKLRTFPIVQEALARQTEGAIEALVYPDPDVLATKMEGKAEKDREQVISEILENIRIAVNKRLPHFYRIKKCKYQTEPFIKNAANKIKRFLYSNQRDIDHRASN
jgi:long-chain acyl-CoA synthetase